MSNKIINTVLLIFWGFFFQTIATCACRAAAACRAQRSTSAAAATTATPPAPAPARRCWRTTRPRTAPYSGPARCRSGNKRLCLSFSRATKYFFHSHLLELFFRYIDQVVLVHRYCSYSILEKKILLFGNYVNFANFCKKKKSKLMKTMKVIMERYLILQVGLC